MLLYKRLNRYETKRLLRHDMLKQQGGRCFYCDKPLTLNRSTFDHRIPVSKGGSNQVSNLVVACVPCNQEKADKIWA